MVATSRLKVGLEGIIQGLRTTKAVDQGVEAAWRAGDLGYKLRPVQRAMRESIANARSLKRVLNCSRRIGKSYLGCIKAIEKGIQKDRAQIRFAAPTQKSLRKIIHPIMREVSMDAPDDLRPIWKNQDGLYLIPRTGSEIHVAGCNNGHEENLRGQAADAAIVEEAGAFKGNLRYVVDDILMPQLLTTGGDLLMIGTPPRTPVHDFVAYVQEAQLKGAYAEYDIYKSGYAPELIEQFCEEAGGPKSTTWLREYMCQFVVDSNFAIVPEWRDDYASVVEPDQFFKYYHRYVSMDIGVRDYTALLFGYYDFRRGKLVIEDEIIIGGPEVTTDRIASKTKAKEKERWAELGIHRRTADNNNLILLNDLSRLHGLAFVPTSKDDLVAMVNQVRLWVAGGRILVHPRCQHTIGGLKYGIWDENRKEFDRSTVYGHFDALAALIYMVRNVNVHDNPVPATLGMSPKDWHIAPEFGKPDAKKYEAMFPMLGVK